MSEPSVISDRLIERFSGAFTELLDTVRTGVEAASEHPAKARWERKALPILTRDLVNLPKEIDQYRLADVGPLQDKVSRLRFLAREMDRYSLECFSEEVADRIQQSRRLVVLFAWQIYGSTHSGKSQCGSVRE